MGRLRDLNELTSMAADAVSAEVNSSKVRGDAMSDAASTAKRSADALLESEDGRAKALASAAATGGLLAFVFGTFLVAGVGQTQVMTILTAASALAPTLYALLQAAGGTARIADASYERGFCQAIAAFAKRLGDTAGATDARNIPLGPEAVINIQLDTLYKDLDKARQRLQAAGADTGAQAAANRLHERLVPAQAETFLTAGDGRRYAVRIADMSQSSVALKGTLPPLYAGEQVQVGTRRASVIKSRGGTTALQFLSPILPSEFNKRIVL